MTIIKFKSILSHVNFNLALHVSMGKMEWPAYRILNRVRCMNNVLRTF